MNKIYNELISNAKLALKKSYSPYSKFKVGAALLSDDGEIFTGTNIENSSYGLSMCAERVAIYKAVSKGKKRFKALAVAGSGRNFCYPCGACLQVLAEFSKKMDIIISEGKKHKIVKVKELLPCSFELKK